MSLAQIVLPTNKTASIVSDHIRKIGQGERGQVLSVIVLDANNSAYDLTDKIITFSENKEGSKIVSDSESERIKVTDAKAGRFTYTLCEAVYAASGVAWFDIGSKDGTFIDTTKSFNIEVIQDESIHINNDNYVSSLKAFETHYQAVIQRTEENTSALIDQFKKDINQAISDGSNRIQATVDLFNRLKSDWDAELTRQKQAITNLQNDWKEQSDQLKADFNKDKIATINAANKNFSDKLTSIQSDYDTWKQSTINDFKAQLDKLETELKNDEDAQKQLQTAIVEAKSAIDKIQDVDFTQFLHKSDLDDYYKKTEVYNKIEVDDRLKQAGQTKSVNGVKPDSTGNITIKIPSDYVKSVNGKTPDSSGNVNIDAGGVKTINGKNGDVTIPAFAPNLLIGTSDEWDNLPYADTIWSQQIAVQQGDIISASAILDTTKSTSAVIYIRMLNTSGGVVKDYIKGATVTRSIGTSLLDKLVIPTGVTSIKCGIASDDNTNFASVKYKERNLAKWRDTNTPPDMTWLPNVDDTSTAIKDLQNQVTELKNRETYHVATDLSSGIAYSKSHPNVLVLMC